MATESSTLNIEPPEQRQSVRLQQRPLLSISFTSVRHSPLSFATPNKSVAQQTKGATNWKSVGKLENIIWFLFYLESSHIE